MFKGVQRHARAITSCSDSAKIRPDPGIGNRTRISPASRPCRFSKRGLSVTTFCLVPATDTSPTERLAGKRGCPAYIQGPYVERTPGPVSWPRDKTSPAGTRPPVLGGFVPADHPNTSFRRGLGSGAHVPIEYRTASSKPGPIRSKPWLRDRWPLGRAGIGRPTSC